jgi:single-strand DNA-binding protein
MYQITGIVKTIGETQQIKETFKKREFVVSTQDQYPQHILLQLIQDKTEMANSISVGQKVTVNFDIQGREWTSPQGEVKYFVSLNAWRITPEEANMAPSPGAPAPDFSSAPPPPPPPVGSNDDVDDLPF